MKTSISPPELDRALRQVALDRRADPHARVDAAALVVGDIERRYEGGVRAVAKGLLWSIAAGASAPQASVLRRYAERPLRDNPGFRRLKPMGGVAPEVVVRRTEKPLEPMEKFFEPARVYGVADEMTSSGTVAILMNSKLAGIGIIRVGDGPPSRKTINAQHVVRALLLSGGSLVTFASYFADRWWPDGREPPSDIDRGVREVLRDMRSYREAMRDVSVVDFVLRSKRSPGPDGYTSHTSYADFGLMRD